MCRSAIMKCKKCVCRRLYVNILINEIVHCSEHVRMVISMLGTK